MNIDAIDGIDRKNKENLMSSVTNLMNSFSELLDLLNNQTINNKEVDKQIEQKIQDLKMQGDHDIANKLQEALGEYRNNKDSDAKQHLQEKIANIFKMNLNTESKTVSDWINELESKGKGSLANHLRMQIAQGNMQMTNSQAKKHAQLQSGVVGAQAKSSGSAVANFESEDSQSKKNLHETAQGLADALKQLTDNVLTKQNNPDIEQSDKKAQKNIKKLLKKYGLAENSHDDTAAQSNKLNDRSKVTHQKNKKVGGLTREQYQEMQQIGNNVKQQAQHIGKEIQSNNPCGQEAQQDSNIKHNPGKSIPSR